ncbi:MAG TPA: sigma-70 family RNA polymerase sigma factor [Polyangiaceae bacterium]
MSSAGPAYAPWPTDASRLTKAATDHYPFVWRLLRRVGVAAAAADDAAQQVFVVLSQKIGRVEPGLERAFLVQTALRVSMSLRRDHAQRRESLGDDQFEDVRDSAPLPDASAEERERRTQLDAVLEALPADLRAVFVLYELEELSLPEIASLLTLPVGTATSRLRRARELFRAEASRLCKRLERRTR